MLLCYIRIRSTTNNTPETHQVDRRTDILTRTGNKIPWLNQTRKQGNSKQKKTTNVKGPKSALVSFAQRQ